MKSLFLSRGNFRVCVKMHTIELQNIPTHSLEKLPIYFIESVERQRAQKISIAKMQMHIFFEDLSAISSSKVRR